MTRIRPILPELSAFGVNVRRERMARRFTQEKLAEATGLNPRTIQKIEAGKINILLTTVLRLQKALGCRWDKLMLDLPIKDDLASSKCLKTQRK